MNDGSVGGPDKHWPVVIDVYDHNEQVCSAPQGGAPLICSHHRQVETLRRLEQAARADQPRVWIQGERV